MEYIFRAPDMAVSTYDGWLVFAETNRSGQPVYLLVKDPPGRNPRLSEADRVQRVETLELLATEIARLDYTAFVMAPTCERLEMDVPGANVRQLTHEEANLLRQFLRAAPTERADGAGTAP